MNDLGSSAARFRQRFGLASLPGGRHAAWGTANRIVPLGDTYLELMGVGDPEVAPQSMLGRRVAAESVAGDAWLSWVLRVDDVAPVAERLGLEVRDGSRERPDGSVLSWRIAGLEVALAAPPLPFFIEWRVPAGDHPGAMGEPVVDGIAWIEVAGDPEPVEEWVGAELPWVRFADGPPGLRAVAIGTPGAEMVVRADE